ncbi:deaminase [Zymobacter sp. IVIA_5232.4 C2]|uniref:deaminase n=1 Tax=Zymobacter sp. IVIA_5232.4 C2 TaxID=3394855 RepID=UPI0039C11F6E
MNKRYDPILALFRNSRALAPVSSTSKGALLESHSGETFHGFHEAALSRASAAPSSSHKPHHGHHYHAAVNVLHKAGEHCQGATLYMTSPPCLECSQAILDAGIRRVVHPDHYGDQPDYESCEQGNLLLGLNGVEVELWTPDRYAMN